MSLAVVYVNSRDEGGRYVREAERSAQSFRKYLPDAKFYLFTNLESEAPISGFDSIVQETFYVPDFLKERVHLSGQMIVKHRALLEVKEESVLYLGADTYALKQDVAELPMILDRFDIAASHAPVRINTEVGNSPIPEVPKAFPELNGDLILFRNTAKVRQVLTQWKQDYLDDRFGHTHDQGTLRHALYMSELRVCILPPEYNYRGHEYREDTIILQNRHALNDYVPGKRGFVAKVINQMRSMAGSSRGAG